MTVRLTISGTRTAHSRTTRKRSAAQPGPGVVDRESVEEGDARRRGMRQIPGEGLRRIPRLVPPGEGPGTGKPAAPRAGAAEVYRGGSVEHANVVLAALARRVWRRQC